jgi:hypothetical protein
LEHADRRHALVTLASSLGELTCARRVQWSIDALAQKLSVTADACRGLRLGSMSNGWLRQHELEFEKHRAGQ